MVFNTGAAFSLLQGKTSLLIFITCVFIVLFMVYARGEKNKSFVSLIAAGFILGGAISNLCDRVFLGYVVDYIDLRIWPIFNISDSCITIGASILFLSSVFPKHGKNS